MTEIFRIALTANGLNMRFTFLGINEYIDENSVFQCCTELLNFN